MSVRETQEITIHNKQTPPSSNIDESMIDIVAAAAACLRDTDCCPSPIGSEWNHTAATERPSSPHPHQPKPRPHHRPSLLGRPRGGAVGVGTGVGVSTEAEAKQKQTPFMYYTSAVGSGSSSTSSSYSMMSETTTTANRSTCSNGGNRSNSNGGIAGVSMDDVCCDGMSPMSSGGTEVLISKQQQQQQGVVAPVVDVTSAAVSCPTNTLPRIKTTTDSPQAIIDSPPNTNTTTASISITTITSTTGIPVHTAIANLTLTDPAVCPQRMPSSSSFLPTNGDEKGNSNRQTLEHTQTTLPRQIDQKSVEPPPPPYTNGGSSNEKEDIVVPMCSPIDGKVVGYRRQYSNLWVPSSGSSGSGGSSGSSRANFAQTPPESPLYNNNNNDDQHTPLWNTTDAFNGFPDAENQVPGYVLSKNIVGRGGFSTVRKALHLPTMLPVAVKVIEKSRLTNPKDRDRVDREVRVMRALGGHPAIAQLFQVSETSLYIYIFMELCGGGTLLEYVRNKSKLDEGEARTIFCQVIAAIRHCHRRGVVHRDIKLENILLDGQGGVRLIDFGLCGYYVKDKALRCHCGSPSYAAPEIVARKEYIAPPVDVWSAGVVLYAMLAGYLPFHAKDKRALSEKIVQGSWKPPTDGVSPKALDLLSKMLTLSPHERIPLDDILLHPWCCSCGGDGCDRVHGTFEDTWTKSMQAGEEGVDMEVARVWSVMRGVDMETVVRGVRGKVCSAAIAGYHILRLAAVE